MHVSVPNTRCRLTLPIKCVCVEAFEGQLSAEFRVELTVYVLTEEHGKRKTATRPVKGSAGETGEREAADFSRVNERLESVMEQVGLFMALNNCSRAPLFQST